MAGNNIGTAYLQVIPTTKGIQSDLQKEMDKSGGNSGEKFGSSFASKLKKIAGFAAVGATIGKVFKDSLLAGADLEQSIGGVETLFGTAADVVKKNASKAYKEAGISANTYMEQATSFSAALVQSLGGDVKKAANVADLAIKDMADNSAKMGTPIENLQNAYQGFAKQNYTMLDNLKLGYGGTKTEMERLLADAEKLTGIHYDIDNLSDVYEAIHVIQGELNLTGVAADEAKKTLSGSFNAMKAAYTDFLGILSTGGNIKQATQNLVDTGIIFAFDNLIPAVINIAKNLFPALGTAIAQGLPALANNIMAATPQLISALAEGISNIATQLGIYIDQLSDSPEARQKAIKAIGNFAKNLLLSSGELLLAIGDLAGAILEFGLSEIDLIFTSFEEWIGGLISNLWINAKTATINGLASLFNTVVAKFEAIKNAVKSAIDKIKSFFNITLQFKGIKLPHITIGWKTSGAIAKIAKKMGLPGLPDFGVQWYRTGGIFNDPSIIGVGEAGSEAVVPLDKLWSRFDAMADNIATGVATALMGANSSQPIIIQTYLYPGSDMMDEYTVRAYDRGKRRLANV